jgi:hypothetical protein
MLSRLRRRRIARSAGAIRVVFRDDLRLLPERAFPDPPQWRFDVVTVYYEGRLGHPTIELFQNALLSS